MPGYWGIWYANQPVPSAYRYKYSGGLGTYCAKHVPLAIYAPRVQRTFFCYGGRLRERNTLVHMVSWYDHARDVVPRPALLLFKHTDDAHDNPTLAIDDAGHLWVFSPAHGTNRPAFIHRSREPYSIDAFELVWRGNFSYPQPWHVPGHGFLFLHTNYVAGRRLLGWSTSPDGRAWSDPAWLAGFERGHYQVSWRVGTKVATAFNYHPMAGGLNARTNLYYVETRDMGRTWTTLAGDPVSLPLQQVANPALVHDYAREGLLVYLKDLTFDADGNPVVLYLTSRGYAPGPENGARQWMVAYGRDGAWTHNPVLVSDSNYDTGCLHVNPDGTWVVVGPSAPGPQPYNPGGEVATWTSRDAGASWQRESELTRASPWNHTYVRKPVNAHPGFYAFWADGHAREPSASRLYFYQRDAGAVRQLPGEMQAKQEAPRTIRPTTRSTE